MNTLLYISSSIFGERGKSTELTDAFVQQWVTQTPSTQVVHRDLAAQPVPHLDGARFEAFTTPAAERTPEQQTVVDFSDSLINEWRHAHTVVLGLPMYNLGLPSTLKAYIDHIARAGETFRYTANGPVGLLHDRKVFVIATRGGQYQNTEFDTQSSYIRHILGLMGISDIEFIYAEGLNMGDAIAEQALRQARESFSGSVAA